MTSISDIKIGKKIALVLGTNVLLVAGLSGLALWGLRTSKIAADDLKDRFEKAQLVETVIAETSSIGQNSGKMIIGKTVTDEIVSQLLESRKNRLAALQAFKARIKTANSIKQAEEMSDLVNLNTAANDQIMASLRAGRYAEAAEEFNATTPVSLHIRALGKVAAQWQTQLTAEHEETREKHL